MRHEPRRAAPRRCARACVCAPRPQTRDADAARAAGIGPARCAAAAGTWRRGGGVGGGRGDSILREQADGPGCGQRRRRWAGSERTLVLTVLRPFLSVAVEAPCNACCAPYDHIWSGLCLACRKHGVFSSFPRQISVFWILALCMNERELLGTSTLTSSFCKKGRGRDFMGESQGSKLCGLDC